jgi:hypothetical protein
MQIKLVKSLHLDEVVQRTTWKSWATTIHMYIVL